MYYRKYLFKDYTKILNKLAMSTGVFEVNQVFFREQNQLIKLESKKTTMCKLDVYKIDNIGISNTFDLSITPNGYEDGSFYVNPTDQSYYYSMLKKIMNNFTPLSKFRYKPIPDDEFAVEYVDIYPDLILMIYEFTTETAKDEFITPSFCGVEVTNNPEYDEYTLYRKLIDKPKVITLNGKDLKINDIGINVNIDNDYNIITTKDDILTKDLEECNENPVLIGDVTAKRTIKAGEAIRPNDFRLEYNHSNEKKVKKKGRPKGSINKKRNGYEWINMAKVIH
jgi:hypothetical protein